MQTTKVYTADGSTKIFQSDRAGPKSSYYLAVFLGDSTTAVDLDDYSIINNAVVFNTAPLVDVEVTVQTSTTDETALQSPFDVSTVATNYQTIKSVADNMTAISNASTNAATATTKAATATTQAGIATTKAGIATTQAGIATTQAGIATTSATSAQSSASGALSAASASATTAIASATSAASAATAQQAAEDALDAFEDTYLGAKAGHPSVDNDGNALEVGAWYFNTGSNRAFIYSGTTNGWVYSTIDTTNVSTQSSNTGALHLPSGTTNQRDGTPEEGDLRWNTTDNKSEIYNGTTWENFGGAGDDNVQSNWSETDANRDDYITNKPGNATTTVDGFMDSADKVRLDNIETAAEVNNITDTNVTDLTDAGDTTLHYHSSDRARATHTGTQTMSTVIDAGTSATLDVPASGNAGTDEVVKGTDTRLSDDRNPTSHNHDHDALTNFVANEHIDWTVSKTDNIHTDNYTDTTYSGLGTITVDNTNNQISTTAEQNVQSDWTATSGDAYIANKPTVATLGESSTTAYRGDRGKIAYDHQQTTHAVSGAQVNVKANWTEATATDDAYIQNKPTIPTLGTGNTNAARGDHAHSGTYDKYDSWSISDGTNSEAITTGATLNITGSGDTTATYTALTNTLDISSTDSGDTTYSAGTALDLAGTTFNVDLSELTASSTAADADSFAVVTAAGGQARVAKGSVDVNTLDWAQKTVSSSEIANNAVDAAALNVAGNGTANQILASDGDGSFSWTNAGAGENNVQANWNETDTFDDAHILNKPNPAAITDVSGTPTLAVGITGQEVRTAIGAGTSSDDNVQSDWTQATTTDDAYINNKPTLGSSSSLNVPATGDAGLTEVVKGNDTRLSDARPPTAHTHTGTYEPIDTNILRGGADVDIGAFSLTAQTLVSNVAQGTAPLTVTSTTVVPNLNASTVTGKTVATNVPANASFDANTDKVWSGASSDLGNTSTARASLGLVIGTDVQAHDADTAKLDVDQAWTGSQRSALVDDNDGSFDMNLGQNFKCTVASGTVTLTFTNMTNGQSGFIWLVNSGATIAKHTSVLTDATILTTLTTPGTYLVSYISDGTNVVLTNSAALT